MRVYCSLTVHDPSSSARQPSHFETPVLQNTILINIYIPLLALIVVQQQKMQLVTGH
jgi:hypothetical protein